MVQKTRSIVIDHVGSGIIRMTWQHHVEKADLRPVFQDLMQLIHAADTDVRIVVDLTQNPQFPILETTMEAMRGPFRSPKVLEWLVIGANKYAYWIGDMLVRATGRKNIVWLNTETDLEDYLAKLAG